jgi:hypothetical protein
MKKRRAGKKSRATSPVSSGAKGRHAFSPYQIDQMNEADLRKKILIPLFVRMGFRDVREYHGGALEQGKDIVMWRADEIRQRVNYGVVAKATKLTGKAKDVNEICTQVRQCWRQPYLDFSTGEQKLIDLCVVKTP